VYLWFFLTPSNISSVRSIHRVRFTGGKQMIDQRYYSPAHAAEVLAVDSEQVIAWIHAGELTAVNVAKSTAGKRPRWRIAENELGRFLMRRRHPATMQQPAAKPSRVHAPKKFV
jgi:hypothetical protein